MTAHEHRARARKIEALLRAIARERIPVHLVEQLDDDGWALLARHAGVRMPSEVTREYVLAAARAWHADVERELVGARR